MICSSIAECTGITYPEIGPKLSLCPKLYVKRLPGLLTSLHPRRSLLNYTANGYDLFVSVTAEETVPDSHRFTMETVPGKSPGTVNGSRYA